MEIKELIDLLPEDYEKQCYEKKAIRRKRTIKNPLDLLVLILYYLYDNHSLVDVSQFAILKNSDMLNGGLGVQYIPTTETGENGAVQYVAHRPIRGNTRAGK